ncbi:hypothetical protein Bache_0355 [Bacteroides helcogenes P 36-108]|uniref:Transglutaminase domain-containing protein n=2 Tax=Bacteroides helcogenes TaxID=290053 RepID=E6SUG6_BACT6|nr:hypothetical protein Bache_0355 [Bacteroides helcogenes P 36-108]
MKALSAACIAGFLSAMPLCGQNIDKEFEEFEKKQQSEFEEFKSKADAEFETFLRETWQKYEAFAPVPAPVRPEPPKPVIFDKTKPSMPPMAIKPGALKVPEAPVPTVGDKVPVGERHPVLPFMEDKPAPGVYVPGKPYTPVLVAAPVVKPGRTVLRTPIDFYGTDFEVATDVIEDFTLSGDKEANVADAWKGLCQKDYEQLLSDCMTLKKERNLSDWAYLLFTKRIGEQLYGKERTGEVVFLQMFLLCKSGYKVRLAKIDDGLKLMIATAGTVYATPFLKMDGDKYYVFEPNPKGSKSLYTYRQNFADAKNLVCLNIERIPEFSVEEQERELSPSGGALKVRTVVNKNLMDFYRDYPQCDVVIHYKTPMSEELRSSLYPQLKKAVEGKSQKDAANLLLNFVQTALQYKTDGDQFGYEKPNFPDETFYYPYCDCEDRAMLYSILVRDLLGLETILLDYPNHIASAVHFTENIPGDCVVLDDGTEFLVCDPTYIGAPIGMCMDQYKNVGPEVIR